MTPVRARGREADHTTAALSGRIRTIQICLNVISVAPLLGSLDLAQLRTIARAYGTRGGSGTFSPKDLQQYFCHDSD